MSKQTKLWRVERVDGQVVVTFFGDMNDVPVTLTQEEANQLAADLVAPPVLKALAILTQYATRTKHRTFCWVDTERKYHQVGLNPGESGPAYKLIDMPHGIDVRIIAPGEYTITDCTPKV